MPSRNRRPAAARWAAVTVVTLLVVALPTSAPAGALNATPQDGWFAWLGCWRLENDRTNDQEQQLEGEHLVCLSPAAGGAGVTHTSLVDGAVVLQEELVADGSRRPVEDAGCNGWERGIWSNDRDLLYVQSELTCEGGARRSVSGASLLTGSSSWLDISVVNVAGNRELVVRRYRAISAMPEAPGIGDGLVGRETAIATSRVAAGAALDAADIVEAVTTVDPAVVEAMLVETNASFPIDGHMLIALDDAGVPPGIIDLMVALSFPAYFAVNEETQAAGAVVPGRPVVYAYPNAWFAPFGYGYYYPWRPYSTTIIVPGPRYGGSVVSGRGYTRVQPRDDAPSGGFGRLLSGSRSSGSGGGSAGSVTKSGTSSGSKSGSKPTGRKAKRRSGS